MEKSNAADPDPVNSSTVQERASAPRPAGLRGACGDVEGRQAREELPIAAGGSAEGGRQRWH
eukprot:8808848-Pyramimonas_sp.AAC.1